MARHGPDVRQPPDDIPDSVFGRSERFAPLTGLERPTTIFLTKSRYLGPGPQRPF
jgi:hypothetical protein